MRLKAGEKLPFDRLAGSWVESPVRRDLEWQQCAKERNNMMLQDKKTVRKHIACNRDKVPGMQSAIAIFMGEIPFRSFKLGDVSLLVQTVRSETEVFCNIGNPHAVGQKPITFYRQVDWVWKVVKGVTPRFDESCAKMWSSKCSFKISRDVLRYQIDFLGRANQTIKMSWWVDPNLSCSNSLGKLEHLRASGKTGNARGWYR